jgi:hypothetical protein
MFDMFVGQPYGSPSSSYLDTDIIVDNPHGRQQISPCRHEKTRYGNGEYDMVRLIMGVPGTWNAQYSWDKGMCSSPPLASLLTLPAFGAWDLYQAQTRAWRELQPQMKNAAGFSGSNFLYEMKELKGAPAQILRLGHGVLAAAKNIFRHESHRTLAELQLVNSYAYQPLVRDVASMSVILGESSRAMERFNSKASTWNTMHYTESLPVITVETAGATFVNYQATRGSFNASVRCKYDEIRQSAAGTFLEYHGLTLTPRQIWEMIPFSFLVDQVLTVGKSLELLSRTPVPNAKYGTFLCSTKLEAARVACIKQNYYVRYFNGGSDSLGLNCGPHHPISWVSKTVYDRFISLPPALMGVPVPQFKKPSFTAILNDLALLRTGAGWKSNAKTHFNGPKD